MADPSVSPSIADSDLIPISDQEDDDYVDPGGADDFEDPEFDIPAIDEEDDFAPDDDPEDEYDTKPKGKGKAKAKVPKRPSKVQQKQTSSMVAPKGNWNLPEGAKRSTVLALQASELMAFPAAYRDALIASSATIARTPTYRGTSGSIKLSTFPIGPMTPFTTHLVEPYDGKVAKIRVTLDGDDAVERARWRRNEAREAAKRVSVFVPWSNWTGEPWFKETYGAQRIAVDGEEEGVLPPGWLWRTDVRLGLENVGRQTPDILPSAAARQYLPATKPLKVHMGAVGAQSQIELTQFSHAVCKPASEVTTGVVFNVGGPVWGLDWCPHPGSADSGGAQYVAVSTAAGDLPIGYRGPPEAHGSIQVWSVNEGATSAKCELVLCVEGGAVRDLKWMPLGAWDTEGDNPKLGIVAAVQEDGAVALYPVPHPSNQTRSRTQPTYLRAAPLLRLSVADAACICIDWLSGLRIVAGLSDGHIAVWDLECLREGVSAPPLPSFYFPATNSPIRSIAAGRCPPTDAEGNYDYSGDAVFVTYSSWDGTLGIVDLRDPGNGMDINRARLPAMAVAWAPYLATPVFADVDYMVSLAQFREVGSHNYILIPHRGPIWDIATSDYHPMVASAGSDGSVNIANYGMGFYRRKMGGLLYQRLYELDYDEHADEYRMSESFMPEASSLDEAVKYAKKRSIKNNVPEYPPTEGDVTKVKTGVWSRNVGIQKVAWQNGAGIGRAGWLASGGWAGLVRVDKINDQRE